jgi:hypothetical protein
MFPSPSAGFGKPFLGLAGLRWGEDDDCCAEDGFSGEDDFSGDCLTGEDVFFGEPDRGDMTGSLVLAANGLLGCTMADEGVAATFAAT